MQKLCSSLRFLSRSTQSVQPTTSSRYLRQCTTGVTSGSGKGEDGDDETLSSTPQTPSPTPALDPRTSSYTDVHSKEATRTSKITAGLGALDSPNSSIISLSTLPYPSASTAARATAISTGIPPPDLNLFSTDALDRDGGILLARLAKLALLTKDVFENQQIGQYQMPELAVEIEQEVNLALDIIRQALDKSGRPCTIDELADRTHMDIVPVAAEALSYQDYMRAAGLRDQLEDVLVTMQVMPPAETMLDGQGKILCRFERKDARKRVEQQQFKERTGLQPPETSAKGRGQNTGAGSIEEDSELELPELRPVTPQELARRKAYMEDMASLSHVLRGFDTALLQVSRVHKVVKEGTTSRMRALVAIGNRNGTAGYGEGKSETAQHAIERACRDAKRNLLHLELHQNRTIYHRVQGKFVCANVSIWPKRMGSGITANNNYSAIFQLFGIKDIGAKQHGSRNLTNSIKALFNGLSKLETPESICASRGLTELPKPPKRTRKPNFRPL